MFCVTGAFRTPPRYAIYKRKTVNRCSYGYRNHNFQPRACMVTGDVTWLRSDPTPSPTVVRALGHCGLAVGVSKHCCQIAASY